MPSCTSSSCTFLLLRMRGGGLLNAVGLSGVWLTEALGSLPQSICSRSKSRGSHAPEYRRADTYLLVRHLDSPADGSLSLASHVAGKHHFVLSEHWRSDDLEILGKVDLWRGYRIVSSINGEGSGSVDKDGGERLATSASGDSRWGL